MNKPASFRGKPVREIEHRGRKVFYVADELVVKLKPEYRNNADAQKAILDTLPANYTLQSGFDRLGMAVISLNGIEDLFDVARKLKSQKAVEFAEPHFLQEGS